MVAKEVIRYVATVESLDEAIKAAKSWMKAGGQKNGTFVESAAIGTKDLAKYRRLGWKEDFAYETMGSIHEIGPIVIVNKEKRLRIREASKR